MMFQRWKIAPAIAVLGAMVATAAQRQSTGRPKASVVSREKRVEAGEEYTKKLLLLMDTDNDGKVSRQEFMSFMQAEFDRLDVKKDGKLAVKESAKLQARPNLGK